MADYDSKFLPYRKTQSFKSL